MAIAFSPDHFRSQGRRHKRFWSMRHFAPAIVCSLLIFPAALVFYDQMQPGTVKAGPLNALSIEHQSWGRAGVPQDIEVRVERSKGLPVKLYLDKAFAESFALERSLPLPKTITSGDEGQILTFDTPADSNLTVTLTLRPLTWGRSEGQLRSDVPGVMMASSTLSELILP